MHRRRADVVVSIVLFLIVAAFSLALVEVTDETEARVRCASNLRQIGQALLLYSNENRGAFPRTFAARADEDRKPTWGTPYEGNEKGVKETAENAQADPFDAKNPHAVAPNDVTAAFFLLVRTQDITSEVYICPSTGQEKWDYGGGRRAALQWSNWSGNKALADHLSYSYQNPYPNVKAIGSGFKLNNAISAEFAVVADMNPGVDALLKLTVDSPATEMQKGNSINHNREGQNVLFGDGHVAFWRTPFVGQRRDNIYTCGNSGDAAKDKGGDGIIGSPVGPDDSILLPTSKDLGTIDADGNLTEETKKRRDSAIAQMAPATPEQVAAITPKLVGTYFRAMQNQKIVLTVTEKTLSATSGPVTIKFDYTIDGASKEAVTLTLTAPDTKATAVVKPSSDGIVIRGVPHFEGSWKRQ
jgi:prepilin-type processing-associated H-X9-DG protein